LTVFVNAESPVYSAGSAFILLTPLGLLYPIRLRRHALARSILPLAKNAHGKTELVQFDKRSFEVVKPFRNLCSRIMPAGQAVGQFGGFSSDDLAASFDSQSLA
jgi:hypothetical protein